MTMLHSYAKRPLDLEEIPPGGCYFIGAVLGAAAIGGITSIIAGSNASDAAEQAAQIQADAANNAAARTQAQFDTIRQDLAPFVGVGTSAIPAFQQLTGTGPGGNPLTAFLTKPFQPTVEQLAQTPGYQFTLQQGLQATQNALTAQGLGAGPIGATGGSQSNGLSGPGAKAIAQYTTGLADSTYLDQLKAYLTQNQQIYNMLAGPIQTGQNAAAQQANFGAQGTAQTNALLTSAAASQAAGQIGSANAFTQMLNGLGGSATNAATILALTQGDGIFGQKQRQPNPLTGGTLVPGGALATS